MKSYSLFFLFWVPLITWAQETPNIDTPKADFKASLNGVERVLVESRQTIVLRASEGDHLIIPGYNEIDVDIKQHAPTRETSMGYFVFRKANQLIIKDFRERGTGTTLFLPKNQNISIRALGPHNIHIDGFSGDIEAQSSTSGHILIEESTGPLVLNTNLGNIEITFNTRVPRSSISALSTTGNISLAIPAIAKATLDLASGTTLIESHFSIKGKSVKNVGEKKQGTINGGGPNIVLATSLGRIQILKIQ